MTALCVLAPSNWKKRDKIKAFIIIWAYTTSTILCGRKFMFILLCCKERQAEAKGEFII